MMTDIESKPYHRQEGEPNLWYDRFHTFMCMGAGRSFARCYREVINRDRSLQGRPLLPGNAKCPGSWRQRAREFDWVGRAEAYDQERRRLALQKKNESWMHALNLAPEAVNILEKTMFGELKDPDGKPTEGQNCTQRRLAAEGILDWADSNPDIPSQDDGDIQQIKIKGIIVERYDDSDETSPNSQQPTNEKK
ncbi:hypothetical protein ACFLXI_04245 [Chloroflexota bacterium]